MARNPAQKAHHGPKVIDYGALTRSVRRSSDESVKVPSFGILNYRASLAKSDARFTLKWLYKESKAFVLYVQRLRDRVDHDDGCDCDFCAAGRRIQKFKENILHMASSFADAIDCPDIFQDAKPEVIAQKTVLSGRLLYP